MPEPQARNFIKKETLTQVFSCEFCEIFKELLFYRTPLTTASAKSTLFQTFFGRYYKICRRLIVSKIIDSFFPYFAEALCQIMNDLFDNVIYAGIDTDKHKYPIGKHGKYISTWHLLVHSTGGNTRILCEICPKCCIQM